MALGNCGLGDFTPKASKTAESLLSVSLKKENIKMDDNILIRLKSDVKQLFKEICEANGVEVSDVLRAYIETVITHGRF